MLIYPQHFFWILIIPIKAAGLLVRVLLFQQFAAAAIYTSKLNRYIGRLLETDENFGNEPKLFGIRDEFILNHNSDNGFKRARTPTNSEPVCTSVCLRAHDPIWEITAGRTIKSEKRIQQFNSMKIFYVVLPRIASRHPLTRSFCFHGIDRRLYSGSFPIISSIAQFTIM